MFMTFILIFFFLFSLQITFYSQMALNKNINSQLRFCCRGWSENVLLDGNMLEVDDVNVVYRDCEILLIQFRYFF